MLYVVLNYNTYFVFNFILWHRSCRVYCLDRVKIIINKFNSIIKSNVSSVICIRYMPIRYFRLFLKNKTIIFKLFYIYSYL